MRKSVGKQTSRKKPAGVGRADKPLYSKPIAGSQKALKLSARARYGLRILTDIALHAHDKAPRTTAAIAKAQQISEKFISRLVIPLRQAGMIRSQRGLAGGFRLARAPEDITLLEVVETMQGPLAILDCLAKPGLCARDRTCTTRLIWGDVNTAFANALAKISLGRVLQRTHVTDADLVDYCI